MPSFLNQLAEKIAQNNEIPLEQTIVVVPNKRATRELLRELASHFTQPVFAPAVFSINEFIENFSSLKKINNDELLVRLFEIYKKKNSEKSDDFNGFLKWAPLFLNDINEIDMHLADAKVIFSNLSEIKTLETSFGKEHLTEAQREYLTFYTQLADLYDDFTSSLQSENLGYTGMLYKSTGVARNALARNAHRYIFAGFNALTPAELEILHYYQVHHHAEIYFDIDHFYAEKYGLFIEEIRQKLRISDIPKSYDFKNIPKQITCIGAPKRTAQIYQAIEILNNIEQKQGNLNDTALVLADESLLIPFVHAYNTENVNITMGYPLRATFAAQQLQQYIDEEKQNNRLQKPNCDLKKQGVEFLNFLKSRIELNENSDIDTNSLISIIDEVSVFIQKFFPNNTALDFAVVDYFLQERLTAATIPFSGNPHEGLQVMGLLETRMLDFKNVIVLSVNEGVLPKGKPSPSLLLYDIKRHFGLPTHQRMDAIFGYHFFRLLQRANEVYLIYDNDSTNAVAEKSRFVEQLEFEVKKQHLQENVHFIHNQFVVSFPLTNIQNKICIEKNADILAKVSQLYFSPSSLNTYIKCPLQFYWRYIEKITSPEIFDESNESAIIGSVIHGILEELFIQLKENPSQSSAILNEFEKNMDEWVAKRFWEQPEICDIDIYQGKLFLAHEVVRKSVLEYLKVVKNEWINFTYQIIGTEIPLVAQIEVDEKTVKIFGKADRVEMRDNKVTVLDYKTGKVEADKLKCKADAIDLIFTDPKYAQLFQLLCYAYMYQNNQAETLVQTAEIQCGIIAFQELYKQNEDYIFYAEINKDKVLTHELMQLFEEYLKQLLVSILDEHTPICQTEDTDNCKYCDYLAVCGKR